MCEREHRIIENVKLLAEEAIGSGLPSEIRLARDVLKQIDQPSPPLADLITDTFSTDPKPGEDY